MPDAIVLKGEHGLPYSTALMAQSLSASGLSLGQAHELARAIGRRLEQRGSAEIALPELERLAVEVLREEAGEEAVGRYENWRRLDRLDRTLIVLLAGAPGVGKSTVATMLASRLGITRVIATDAIRHVIRAFFSPSFMPVVHYSSFEAAQALPPAASEQGDADIAAFTWQASNVATGVRAIIDRACQEGTPMVLEGVHLIPGLIDAGERALAVPAVLAVEDEELHRGHFAMRGGERPADRYLRRFEQIRKLQDHLVERARATGVPVIENVSADEALERLMDVVLAAVESTESG